MQRIAELMFEDMTALQRGLGSEQGQAAVNDIANFAAGGVTISSPRSTDELGRSVAEGRSTSGLPGAAAPGSRDERGRFRRIDVRGAAATRPGAINKRGQIAGEFVDRAGRSHGYLQDSDGSVTTIDPPGPARP